MSTLTNTKIKDTYVGLLKTTDNQAIDASGVTLVEDGAGNASALSVGRSGNGVTVTGNLTVDTNTLFVDAANNRVGVGTSSPAVELDIASAAPQVRLTDTDGGYCEVTNVGGNLFLQADKGNTESNSYMRFDVDGSERMRIDSSGNVGIGTASPSRPLHVNSGATNDVALFESTDAIARISIQDNTAKTDLNHNTGIFTVDVDPDNVGAASNFIVNVDGSEKTKITNTGYLRMASGTLGIQFNGDTAAANALDDYEEGTWSPVYESATGSYTTMTMDIVTAKYTKIGNLVTVYAQIRTDDVDVTGGSGQVRISGLPFTVSGEAGGIAVGSSVDFTNGPDSGYFINNTTKIQLRKTNASTNLVTSDLSNGTNADDNKLHFTGTYII